MSKNGARPSWDGKMVVRDYPEDKEKSDSANQSQYRPENYEISGEVGSDMPASSGVVSQYDRMSVAPSGHEEPTIYPVPPGQSNEPYDLTFFESYGVNPFINTQDDTFSTFGMDVDTASYTIARRFLQDGNLPNKDSIRTEEFINYFDQNYPLADEVFGINVEGARSRFGDENYHLLKIGIKANDVSIYNRKPANLVFVVDVSGSMAREERLEQVKRSLRTLAESLKQDDRVALVVYGSTGQVISDLTSNRDSIFRAIDQLRTGGSTNAGEGLRLAYDIADRGYDSKKINRIILCSDGVANTGITDADRIIDQIKSEARKGITLTTIGFGMGNYNDVLMEKLANHGDGSYFYIDNQQEADRVFGNGTVAMIQAVAMDAKIQVEFNENIVNSFRLLGYENRRLNKEDFEDDSVDAGEVGAGQTVTALYEISLKDKAIDNPSATVAQVRIRYKNADVDRIEKNEKSIKVRDVTNEFNSSSPKFRFTAAVAEFAEILKESYWAKDGSLEDVLTVANGSVDMYEADEKEKEFIELVERAKMLSVDKLAKEWQ
ncbi:von Willebrand factor type A domain-containing protein [bacterium]|nr:von Willebrand factor type A domain-containing protein [bacterium]MBU1025024.1 von Willebrand factor type A domain-containing protein [bacterium]